MRAIALGIVASFFFASTFVLNRAMDLAGGSWIWSAVLRYVFMMPLLLVIVLYRRNLNELLRHMRKMFWAWLGWSTIGFGVFYALVCFSAAYGPSWLVASTWQTTIIAGSLLVPLFSETILTDNGPQKVRGKIPIKGLLISSLILIGVALVQLQQSNQVSLKEVMLGVIPVVVAAFAYPLGNRKMMAICGQSLDTFQRVLGMTIASMPFWIVLGIYGVAAAGLPGKPQIVQSSIVAVSSGVIATVLFFRATDLTKGDVHQLAAVEATQSGEVVFALLGELIILHGKIPTALSFSGMGLVIVGMVLHSYASHSKEQVNVERKKLEVTDA